MNKTAHRGASANDKKGKKGASKAQKNLFGAASNNNNNQESLVLDNNNLRAPVIRLGDVNTEASVIRLDEDDTKASVVLLDDDTEFNSTSVATASQLDSINTHDLRSKAAMSQVDSVDVNSRYDLRSRAALPQVDEEILGGELLQHIPSPDACDVSSGKWIDWCLKDEEYALQSAAEKDEDDEDAAKKVTSLVELTVSLSLHLKFFVSLPNFQTTLSSLINSLNSETTLSSLINSFNSETTVFVLTFPNPFWVHNYTSWQF